MTPACPVCGAQMRPLFLVTSFFCPEEESHPPEELMDSGEAHCSTTQASPAWTGNIFTSGKTNTQPIYLPKDTWKLPGGAKPLLISDEDWEELLDIYDETGIFPWQAVMPPTDKD